MFVACPHCGFLVAAHGGASQRCPRCGSPIDPRQAKPLPPAAPAAATQDIGDDAAEASIPTPAPPAEAVAEVAADTPRRKRRGPHAPSFARRHAPAPLRSSSRREWLVAAGLALLLALQMLLAQRDALAADARWRPLIAGMCGVLRCELPAWREPAAFTMLQRSVQPKPGTAGVLQVSASFRNDARWPQPWPTVLLTLSDMDGNQVGQRAFKPADYRSGGSAHIAPGESATIQLDVVEPARPVVAFTFDFQ